MNSVIYLALVFTLLTSCNDGVEHYVQPISVHNNFEKDLYIYLNAWNISEVSNKNSLEDFSLSKYFIVNKIISSKGSIEFNDIKNYTFIKTVALSAKEPVFLEFNKLDSLQINLNIDEQIKKNPIYIQLIAFSKKEVDNRFKNHLLFRRKELNLNLINNWRPFENFEVLDSISKISYYDSLEVYPIEIVIKTE